MTNRGRTELGRDDLDYVIAMAVRAPSVHNTQPWRWRFADGALELRVDASRRLRVADPHGRELVISCGASLYTLMLAIRRLGLEPRARLLPHADAPLLLARVAALPGGPAPPDELQLLAMATRRHTHRGPFTDERPSPGLLEQLHLAARAEGARLAVLPDGPAAARIVDLAWQAEQETGGDLGWQAEMLNWAAPPRSGRRDGVPAEAFPATPSHPP